MLKVFSIVLTVLAFLLVSCSGCHPWNNATVYRSPNAQVGATVKVVTYCRVPDADAEIIEEMLGVDAYDYEPFGQGSGVIVSPDRMLTAFHVVECEDGSKPRVKVDPGDKTLRDATVEIIVPGNDVARLKLVNADEELSEYYTPVTIGPRPKLGDKLCMTSAVPRLGYHCGTMQPDRDGVGLFQWDYFTEFGNSGSAVYKDGKLVGLLHALSFCQGRVQCVGHIVPLQDFPWLIP